MEIGSQTQTRQTRLLGTAASLLHQKPLFCFWVEAKHLTKYLSLGSILPLFPMLFFRQPHHPVPVMLKMLFLFCNMSLWNEYFGFTKFPPFIIRIKDSLKTQNRITNTKRSFVFGNYSAGQTRLLGTAATPKAIVLLLSWGKTFDEVFVSGFHSSTVPNALVPSTVPPSASVVKDAVFVIWHCETNILVSPSSPLLRFF